MSTMSVGEAEASPVGDHATCPRTGDHNIGRLKLAGLGSRYGLVLAWVVLVAVVGAIDPSSFLTADNFRSIFNSQAVLLLASLSLLPTLVAGGLDLSVGGVLGLSVTTVGWLNVTMGWPILAAVTIAILVGIGVGLVNAFVVVYLGVDSIVATLGMATALAGASLGINSLPVSGISSGLVRSMTTQVLGFQLVGIYVLVATAIIWYVLRFTPLGRYMFFAGAGDAVARLAGVPAKRIRFGSFVCGSFIAALAGVMLAGFVGSADPTVGSSFLLPAFAGVFLGATTIKPGRFNAWGTWVSIYFLGTGVSALQIIGLAGWIEDVFYGGVLIVALVIPRLLAMRRRQS